MFTIMEITGEDKTMEWNFTYENQEASSFLVYRLEPDDQLDSVGMGMLSNNQIPHILPLLYTQIDEERYLRYAVPSRIPLENFLDGMVSKERLLNVLMGICDAVEEGQAYMLDSSMLVLDKRYIFANVSTGEVALVYLPISGKASALELSSFFREIMFGTQFDSQEDCSYIATIINYLNGNGHFLVTDFKKLLQTLLDQKTVQVSVKKTVTTAPPVSKPVPKTVSTPKAVPKQKADPAKVATPTPVPKPASSSVSAPKPMSIPAAPSVSAAAPKTQVKVEDTKKPEKKGFPFKLPSKKTSEEKQKKTAAVPSIPIPGGKEEKPTPIPMTIPGKTPPVNQGFTAAKVQPPEWGKATQHASFGETSVLSTEIGVTTVLNASMTTEEKTGAVLIRKKTGQRIIIDKLLFRIGTERSFVDYWVSDNSAVSHSHADIVNHDGTYYIRDNHSTNHTYVNGRMVQTDQEQILKDGDQILLGNEPFEFKER